VVLSKELLRDESFAQLLLTCIEGRVEEPIEIVTVNGDTHFEFPPLEFFATLEKQGLGNLGPEHGPRLAKAYRALLSVLALPLSPHGSEALVKEQVREVCRRFRTLEDLTNNSKTFKVEELPEAKEWLPQAVKLEDEELKDVLRERSDVWPEESEAVFSADF